MPSVAETSGWWAAAQRAMRLRRATGVLRYDNGRAMGGGTACGDGSEGAAQPLPARESARRLATPLALTHALTAPRNSCYCGAMFLFTRKRFSGSHFALTSTS